MANSECVSEWKDQILSDLQQDDLFLSVLGVTDEEIEEGLVYKRLFPFRYISERQDDVKTYICVEVDIDKGADRTFQSRIWVRPTITFRIIAHQDDMRIPSLSKTRLDYLAELIDKKYNRKRINNSFELDFLCNNAYDVSTTYRERVVKFRGVALTNGLCSGD